MKLSALLKDLVAYQGEDVDILSLANDSRHVEPGALFIAYPGYSVDGRDYIAAALEKGARAVVCEAYGDKPMASLPVPCIAIEGLAEKVWQLAIAFYDSPSSHMDVTGITGTNGKTSIAYMLATAHHQLGQKSSYIGTLGHGLPPDLSPLPNTTPEPLLLQKLLHGDRQAGIKKICMEVSSHALSLGRVNGMHFSQAIYTNLSHDHLDFHHTFEAYAAAKSKLFQFEGLSHAIFNQDCPFYRKVRPAIHPEGCEYWTYGLGKEADFRVLSSSMDFAGTALAVKTPMGDVHFSMQNIGQFNIYNSLAVLASLLLSGYEPHDVGKVMSRLAAPPGRLEIVVKAPLVVVDYAHTPDALKNVLTTLVLLKKRELWVVFGCGGDRDVTKRPAMGEIASTYADHVVITSDNPRSENPAQIIRDIEAGIKEKVKSIAIEDRKEAIYYAMSHAHPDDIILVAGKGHEAYQEIGGVKYSFSDQDVIRSFLP